MWLSLELENIRRRYEDKEGINSVFFIGVLSRAIGFLFLDCFVCYAYRSIYELCSRKRTGKNDTLLYKKRKDNVQIFKKSKKKSQVMAVTCDKRVL